MKRDYKLYLGDIEESVQKIEKYLQGVSEEDFKKDTKIQDAVIRRLEIIGEACRNIPRALKEKNKDFPWFEAAQLRDLAAHSYHSLSLDRVWKSAHERVAEIKEKLKTISLI